MATWPTSVHELTRVTINEGYDTLSPATLTAFGITVDTTLFGGRAFVTTDNQQGLPAGHARHVVNLVVIDNTGRWRVEPIGAITGEADLVRARSLARRLGDLVDKGHVPDQIQAGQDVALARAVSRGPGRFDNVDGFDACGWDLPENGEWTYNGVQVQP